ncbi:hypothetical protein HGM15179_016492 [Zosterops borbonicus]|uniref:Uncharacterized protein n=1 Tax=Zosterops borbonicus TaxID=364589 RepID=A0A8K1G305_9PASS|nr:hypothetical protein HGM15179_016492 [Zosterops borbonicus]
MEKNQRETTKEKWRLPMWIIQETCGFWRQRKGSVFVSRTAVGKEMVSWQQHWKGAMNPSRNLLFSMLDRSMSQPVYKEEVLQPSDPLHGFSLDSSQVHAFLGLRTLELEMKHSTHEGRRGESPPSTFWPAFDVAQDVIGFVGSGQAYTEFHNGMRSLKMEDEENGNGYCVFMKIIAGIPPFRVCQAIDPNQSEAVPKPSPTGKQHEKRRGEIQPSLTGFNNFQPDLDS